MTNADEIADIRRPVLRSLWFKFHKWIGIVLAIVLIPLSLTGSLLVWHDPLDEMLHPARYAASGPAQFPPSHYVAAARTKLPAGARIVSLALPAGQPVEAIAVDPPKDPGRAGPPQRTAVWLDPVSLRVIDSGPTMDGIIRFAHDFHGSLLISGGNGRTLVGVLGGAMLISALTGLWLWWPAVGGFLRGLRWRRHRHLDGNLHHLTGFWTALPLAVLSLTGVFISFPAILNAVAGAPAGQTGPGGGAARGRTLPLAETRLTADQAVAAALPLAKGAPAMITWPTDRQPAWRIAFGGEGRKRTTVAVDDQTGAAEKARPEERRPGANGLARRIHDGDGMAFIWQLIIFLGGITPAILGVTGIIMWLRMRRVRARAGV